MRVIIRTLNNQNETWPLEVDPEETMESVRDKIKEQFLKPNPFYCIDNGVKLTTGGNVEYSREVKHYIRNEG